MTWKHLTETEMVKCGKEWPRPLHVVAVRFVRAPGSEERMRKIFQMLLPHRHVVGEGLGSEGQNDWREDDKHGERGR